MAELVKAGKLPPVQDRLPTNPVVVQPIEAIGKYGGSWTMVVAAGSDTKLAHAFGYSRLVGWDQKLAAIVPDLCESFQVKDNKEFTFNLRKGLKWSDGKPLTTADFRFYFEDVAGNADLNPNFVSNLLVGGAKPTVTFPDDYTMKFAWPGANHTLLPLLAGGQALEIYLPKHYLSQFHAKYADKAALDKLIKDGGLKDWMALFGNKNHWYQMDNPEMPTMQPWTMSVPPPQEKYEFPRNPYYYKVDPQGNQLPYMDKLVMLSTDAKLVALKCSQGDSDFQSRSLTFDDIALLKGSEAKVGYKTLLWKSAQDSFMYIYPNHTCKDQVLRGLMRDKRFRIALSYAINRKEINDVLFMGYGVIQQAEILPGQPGYNEHGPKRTPSSTWRRPTPCWTRSDSSGTPSTNTVCVRMGSRWRSPWKMLASKSRSRIWSS